jgi:hypothetical protein
MTLGKGVGGGFPLSAVASTDELTSHSPFSKPSGSSSSYGGNPLAAAAGLASLEIITRENLVENSERVGRAMLAKLLAMQEKHRVIGDVRGKGLLPGSSRGDRQTKKLVSKRDEDSFQECLRRGCSRCRTRRSFESISFEHRRSDGVGGLAISTRPSAVSMRRDHRWGNVGSRALSDGLPHRVRSSRQPTCARKERGARSAFPMPAGMNRSTPCSRRRSSISSTSAHPRVSFLRDPSALEAGVRVL